MKEKMINVRSSFPESLHKKLSDYSEKILLSQSAIIRTATMEYFKQLEKHGKL